MDNRLKLLLVAFLAVLAGRTGGAADSGAGSTGSVEGASLTTDVSGSAEAEQTGGDDLPQARRRVVIRNGQIELIVDKFSESRDAVESTAESYGGYVSDSSEHVNRRSGGTYRSGQLVIRVLFEGFSTFMADMKALGEIERVEMNSEDVTNQLADVEVRLSNLRAQCDRLRDFYESANMTEDVLAAEERLTDVQTEIERPEAQK